MNRWRNGPTPRQWLILLTVFVGMLIPWLWLVAIFVWPILTTIEDGLMGLVIAMGIVTFFNLLVLKIKYEKGRTADLIMDVAALIVLNYLFGGTLTGMLVAMIASLCMSIYLWFWPPKFELWN